MAACFVLIALFTCRQDLDFDIGFHLRAGQWILQHGSLPRLDPFTYTVSTHPYIDMLWLYEIACYGLNQLGGLILLSVVHDLLLLAAFGLLFSRLLKTHAPLGAQVLLLFLMALCVELRFLMRPEILSWIFLLLTLTALDQRQIGPPSRLLFLLPLLQIIWVNTEGLFILEWVVLGVYLVSDWIIERRAPKLLLQTLALTLAASLANPYFLKGALFPFQLFTHLQPNDVFHQFIAEFQSPWALVRQRSAPFFPGLALTLYKITSLSLLFLIALTLRKRKPHEWLLAVAFFALSALSVRNISLFFFVALPIGASCVRDLLESPNRWAVKAASLLKSPWAARGAALFILLFCLRVATQAYYVSDRRMVHNGFGLDEGQIPVKAVNFMSRFQLSGTLFNNLAFGSWLDFKGPGPVFIDGRLEVMGASFYAEFLKSYQPGGLKPLLDQYGVQLILLDHMADIPWVAQLRTMGDWRLIYFDDLSAIYAREGYAPQFAALDFRSALSAWNMNEEPADSVLTNLKDVRRFPLADWMDGFGLFENYPMPLMRVGTFAYENGQFQVARDFFLKALEASQGRYYEIYYNLGGAYGRLNRPDLAQLCYQKVLELNPSSAWAKEKLGLPQ